jgi:hypothetical protein
MKFQDRLLEKRWRLPRNSRQFAKATRLLVDALIVADDFSEADGHTILTFGQVQERAKALRPPERQAKGPYTVADAIAVYVQFLDEALPCAGKFALLG